MHRAHTTPRPIATPGRHLQWPALAMAVVLGMLALAQPVQACPAGADGRLVATLSGAVNAQIDWHGAAMDCDGMPRPQDGIRLQFRGELGPGVPLTVLIGIDELAPGVTGREMAANVTLVFEGTGLFFSSRQQTGCWADVTDNARLPAAAPSWRVSGEVYCLRGLAEIGGDASVTIIELTFSGVLATAGDHDDLPESV